jgi:hypothetical protein
MTISPVTAFPGDGEGESGVRHRDSGRHGGDPRRQLPPQPGRDRGRRVRGVDDNADLALLPRGAASEKLHAKYDGADAKHPQWIDGHPVGARVRPEAPEHHLRSQQGQRAIDEPDGGQSGASVLAAQRHGTSPWDLPA